MSPPNSLWWGGPTLEPDPAPDPYLGCTFDLKFHHIDIMLTLCYLQIECLVPLLHSKWWELINSSQTGCSFFPDNHFEHQQPLLSSKFNILSHNSIPSGQIWKIPSQTVVVFWNDHFEYQQPYVIFKIEHFIPYFCLSQYYLLYVYKSHIFYFSSAILIALNGNLELTVFM